MTALFRFAGRTLTREEAVKAMPCTEEGQTLVVELSEDSNYVKAINVRSDTGRHLCFWLSIEDATVLRDLLTARIECVRAEVPA